MSSDIRGSGCLGFISGRATYSLLDEMFAFVCLHFSVWAVCVTVLPKVRML